MPVAGAKERPETLAVGCWDRTLSFYQLSGQQYGGDRELDYDPCSLSYFEEGEYLLIGGSNRKVGSGERPSGVR